MKKIIFAVAISAFALGTAQTTPAKSCCANKKVQDKGQKGLQIRQSLRRAQKLQVIYFKNEKTGSDLEASFLLTKK